MKKEIHPKYYPNIKISCACGAEYESGGTVENLKTELCSACHPFYTGKQKIVDTARRVEKFKERAAKKVTESATRKGKTVKNAAKRAKRAEKTVKVKSEE